MTPAQLINRARQRYNAVGDNFYSDDELLDTVYEAQMDLAIEAECVEKRYTASTVVGQREYAFPTNLIRVARCAYDGQRLDPIDFIEDDLITRNSSNTTSTGKPRWFAQYNDTIFLRPVPSEVKTLEIYAITEPSAVTNTSTLDIPTRYHLWVVDLLLSTMFAKDKNHQLAVYHGDRWASSLQKAKRWEMKRHVNDQYKVSKDAEQMPYQGVYSGFEGY